MRQVHVEEQVSLELMVFPNQDLMDLAVLMEYQDRMVQPDLKVRPVKWAFRGMTLGMMTIKNNFSNC